MALMQRHARAWCAATLVIAALVLLAPLAAAQTETGRITGTVTDASGAVVPGATITLKSIEKGTVRETVSDAGGRYVFANVNPGAYEVTVELSGFNTKTSPVTVTVGSVSDVNTRLEVAGTAETITVTAESAVVNVVNAEVATTISQAEIRELPTITRNVYDLVSVAGNAAQDTSDASGSNRGAGYALNGMRSASTNVLLDGAANNDEFSATVGQAVPLDSVQEFSVVSSNFSAQYGRASGGVVNVVTKSGANNLSGTAYWFFRNEALSTNTLDNKARGIEKDPFDRGQSGFSIGGPIKKNKLFYFGSAEYIRVRSQFTDISYVPTPEFLALCSPVTQAYFGDYTSKPINGPIVRAGEVSGVVPGGPFSQLPASLPVFGQVQTQFPSDAGGGDPRNEWQAVARVDWSISPASTFYVRWAFQWQDFFKGTNSNSPWEGFDTGTAVNNNSFLGSYTRVWSSSFTSQSKVVFNRLFNEQPLNGAPTPTLYMRDTARTTIGGIKIALPGYLPYSPGSGIPFGGPQKLLQLYQDQTWIKGDHDLRFGGSYVYMMDDRTFGAYENSTQGLGSTLGAALDNLVLGRILRFQGAVDPGGKYPGQIITLPATQPDFTRNNRYNEFGLYFNDNWRVSNRVTLNLGLRWEYYGVQHNTDPSLDSNFYYGPGDNYPARIRTGSVDIAPDSPAGGLWAPDWNNFAPRVGFAWDVTGDGKTSLRGGYGIGYERNFGNVTFNVIQNPPNYAVVALTAPADIPVMPIYRDVTGPLSGTGQKVLPATSLRHVDADIVNAYAHFWSAAFQRQLFARTTASVEYVGSAGEQLYAIIRQNLAGDGAVYLGDASASSRPNSQYTAINSRANGGKSRYNAIVASLSMSRLSDWGVDLAARYTYGRAKDNLSSTFSESNNNGLNLGFLDPYDPDLDYGWADFDVRNRISVSGIYELPFFKQSTGLSRTLLGGWQITGIFTAQSGYPFSIFDSTNGNFLSARMRQVAPVGNYTMVAVPGEPNTFVYLDLTNQVPGRGSIFNEITGTNDQPPSGGYPADMSERNEFRGPGRWNVDASFGKRFRFGNDMAINFRLEVYNLFNHANLYLVNDSADLASAETVLAVKGYTSNYGIVGDGQRRIQIGLKFEF